MNGPVDRDLVRTAASAPLDVALTPEAWDQKVIAHDGSLLQSWRWGAFKARHGWIAERIQVKVDGEAAQAQVLVRHVGPVSIAYIPRGPVLPAHPGPALVPALLRAVDTACARYRAVELIVEADRCLPTGVLEHAGFVPGPPPFQPVRSVKVALADDDRLLAGMRRDTRANVRRAQREGVVIERAQANPVTVDRFYALLRETAGRNAFHIHEIGYYQDVLQEFGDDALLAFARVGGEDAAGLIAVRHGHEAVYLYGGSSARHRVRGAAALLQFDAMGWAWAKGCCRYDLWGIPATDPCPSDVARGRITATHGAQWDGLYQFKTGFGGAIVSYPGTVERRYRPVLARLLRWRVPRYRTVAPQAFPEDA
ncbi:MAG TPA: peptidoglycan bridge formation glycyltransferase FemA/FemB family protein [Thermomicrobiales bacterium]|nr:peptidoglycan bridge formation glycyltransferase FemA/FemB family protein [Thermomicrobiales bacterium]